MDLWTLTDLLTPWCVYVAVTLRVPEHIAAGKAGIAELAAACGADRGYLYRMLQHLVSRGVFEEPAPGVFALNETSRSLLSDGCRLYCDLDSFGGRIAYAWGTLLSAVRTGKPAYHEAFGRSYWDDLDAHPKIAADFDALMGVAGHGVPDPEVLPNPADWESIRTVVDVGGGTGSLLAAILQARPQVRGTLVDMPRAVAGSAEVFREAGVRDRAAAVAQNFFDPLPAGGDLYTLKNVLCDWPDEQALAILKRCAEAARPSGRVVVFNNSGPGEPASPELLMMVLVGGRDRTFEELNAIAREAGLEMRAHGRQASGRWIIEYLPV